MGDSTALDSLLHQLKDTLESFIKSNPENLFYRQDLGLAEVELGSRSGDKELVNHGLTLLWDAFKVNPNSSYAFRKLVSVLINQQRYSDVKKAAEMHAEYKINLNDPFVQQLLGLNRSQPAQSSFGQ